MDYLIFGGTGSLGTTLVKRLKMQYNKLHVFARGEEKHHKLKLQNPGVNCIVGDVRDYDAVERAIRTINPDIIINAAAMKQVPLCEDYPEEAVKTNIDGAINIAKAINQHNKKVVRVLSVSTDKVVKPVNSYGMAKALQERIHLRAQDNSKHIFNCVRYGNVLESTGSVIPVFQKLLAENKNLTVTHKDMTRFLLSLDEAVDLIETALEDYGGQKIFVPKVKSAKIQDLAEVMVDYSYDPSIAEEYRVKIEYSGIRPGEKIHEILISEEELNRTQELQDKYVIHDIKKVNSFSQVKKEYSSGDLESLMSKEQLTQFLKDKGVITECLE